MLASSLASHSRSPVVLCPSSVVSVVPSGQRQSYDDCVAGVGLGIILAPSTAAAQLALSAVVSDQRQPTDAEDLVIVTSDYRQPDDAEDLVIVPHLVQDK